MNDCGKLYILMIDFWHQPCKVVIHILSLC